MSTDRQRRLAEQKQQMDKIWAEISKDYSLSARIAQLASDFSESGLDIRNQKQIDLLRKKNPETGLYEPLGLKVPLEFSKAEVLGFLEALDELVQNGTHWVDFNQLSKSNNLYPYAREGNSYAILGNTDLDKQEDKPREVSRPGKVKMFFYNWLGFFKDEVDRYNTYVEEQARYEANEQTRAAMKAVREEAADTIAEIVEVRDAKTLIKNENPPTLEDTLQDEAKEEEEKLQCVDLVAGRRNDKLYFGDNFQKITEIPMDDVHSVKMGGLALLAACSETFNKGIADGSTQPRETFQDNPKLTGEEKELAGKMEKAVVRSTVGSKILDSVFGGTDNNRMNNRMKAVIQSREALNAAMNDYANFDRTALAALLRDCLPSVYYSVCENSRLGDSRNAAVIEIAEAVTDLFKKDETLKNMVDFPESQMQAIRGAANFYKLGAAPAKEKLSRYKADDGPGKPERIKTVEKILVKNILKKIKDTQQKDIKNKNIRTILEKANAPEFTAFKDKYDNTGEVTNGIIALIAEGYARVPGLLNRMGQENFHMNTITEPLLEIIRDLPEYDSLINMEKDQLFAKDFSTLGADSIKAIIEKSSPKEKEQVKTTSAEHRQEVEFVISGNMN